MNRKDFLQKGTLGLMAVTLAPRAGYGFTAAAEDGTQSCIPTTADILGPFYRTGAPMRSDLRVQGDPGMPIILKGKVLDLNCNPLPGAVVDVWQADDAGAYDNATQLYEYRGIQVTDSSGAYEFLTIQPGRYLNGAQYRPSHVHFRVTLPGFTELITQLYFEGDPFITTDPWASQPGAALRIVPVTNIAGNDTAVFDITLNGALGINELGGPVPVRVFIGQEGTLSIESKDVTVENAEIFDVQGRLVASAYNVESGSVAIRIPRNMHVLFARVEAGGKIYVQKVATAYGY